MSFAVPAPPKRTPAVDNAKTTAPVDATSSKGFAIPALPLKRAAMPPPPPPIVSKGNKLEQNNNETQKTRPQLPQTRDSKPMSNAPPLKYQKPGWSGYPNQQFYFEVIKNGVIVERIQVPEKEFLVIGRLPMCDLEMEHPSLSRYHAVVQFKSNGESFIYDLNSSHGTKLNKNKVPPGMHVALKPGDQLRFGESTRLYLFQSEQVVDQEEEERALVKAMIERQNKSRSKNETLDDDGCNWGMQEDAVDDDDANEDLSEGATRRTIDPDAYYRRDPKKALRHYLESKGYACEFELEEEGPGHAREYTARIRLPIETSMGAVYGQATTGKKKDAEREAALDACIQLDSRGMLGQSKLTSEGSSAIKGKKFKDSDSDDDDDFYDRTTKKKSTFKNADQKADTHESLLLKHKLLLSEKSELEGRIRYYEASAQSRKELEDSNDLDAYMSSLVKGGGDSKAKMQQSLATLKRDEKRLLQLIHFTKPLDIGSKIAGASRNTSVSLPAQHTKHSLEPESGASSNDQVLPSGEPLPFKKPRIEPLPPRPS